MKNQPRYSHSLQKKRKKIKKQINKLLEDVVPSFPVQFERVNSQKHFRTISSVKTDIQQIIQRSTRAKIWSNAHGWHCCVIQQVTTEEPYSLGECCNGECLLQARFLSPLGFMLSLATLPYISRGRTLEAGCLGFSPSYGTC